MNSLATSSAFLSHPDFQHELAYGPIREVQIEKIQAAARESTDSDGWTLLKAAIRGDGMLPARHIEDEKGHTRTFYRVTRARDPTDTNSAWPETLRRHVDIPLHHNSHVHQRRRIIHFKQHTANHRRESSIDTLT